jgi:flagellar M-ring protein FliF
MDTLALEGEIATMLEVVNGVTHAIVTLAVPAPHRSFSPGTPPTTASVMVNTSRSFTPQEGRNLALIVTRAVPGLLLENVEIIDHEARAIFLGGEVDAGNLATEAQDYSFRRTNMMRHDLQRLLTTFFDSVQAVPHLQFDTSYIQNQISTTVSAPEGTDQGFVFTDSDRSEWRGMNHGFEPGMGWNQGGIPGYQIGGTGESYGRRDIREIFSYRLNEEITRTDTMGGGGMRPNDSSVSVVASFNRDIRQADWLAEDEERTQRDWEIFAATERTSRVVNGDEFPDFEDFRQLIASASGIPVENVTLIVSEVLNFVHSEARVWDWTTLLMLAVFILLLLMLAFFLLKTRSKDEEEEEAREPELSIEDLLVSTQLEEAKDEEIAALDEDNYFRESEVKKQIEKFVNEKPEAVASLLRNWLNVEEW